MGNKIARTTQVSASEYYLHELPSSYNLVLIGILGRGRFFKSILCKHDEGLVLVKVYFKRGDPVDLKEYERRLAKVREIFNTVQHPHVWPFQFWLETDKAAYLLRQYFFSNLHDRLSTQPFLSLIEKKWLAFQLLCAVKQSHDKDVCHGDIKCENVLVTSWNWLYLVDFASFKPTYIPDDDPSDFSFFFDTGGRRRCYLAPERFYDHGGDTRISPDAPLRKSMDIFSVGCVIAELFLEGQPLFELSQLLAYRRGQYDPSQYLEKIQDAGIQKMILHMIQLDPESRLSCESYLQSYASVIFPSYFSPFLHKFFSCLIPLGSDSRVAVTQSAFREIHNQMTNNRSTEEILLASPSGNSLMNGDSVLDMEKGRKNMAAAGDSVRDKDKLHKGTAGQLVGDIASLISEVEQRNHRSDSKTLPDIIPNASLCPSNTKSYSGLQSSNDPNEYKEKEIPLFRKILKSDLNSLIAGYNSESDTYALPLFQGMECKLSIEGMVLIASLLCSCIRSVKQPHLRRAGVIMLKLSSFYIDDEDRLQHVLPYVVAMLSDPAAIVRCAALETLCDILALVRDFPPSDAKIFPEYILPMLSMLPDDPEESVRICYAGNIFKIALTAYKFLLRPQSSTEAGILDRPSLQQKSQSLTTESEGKMNSERKDAQLAQLRKSIAEVVQELVMGPKQTPNIRRALLQDIAHLCLFFGQRQSNDFLLPILPAFLNDRDDQLRAVFYDQIVFVCYFVGQRSVEEYLSPYIEQALSDNMEAVIVNALECLSLLCTSGFLRKRILLDMIDRAFPLLCYPIQWVRRAIVTFIAASSRSLGPVGSHVYLSPVVRPFLLRESASLSSEISLLSCLKPPCTKKVFYNVLKKDSDMLERQRKLWYNSSASPNQWETLEHNKRVSGGDQNPMKSSGSKEPNAQNGKHAGGTSLKLSSQDTEDVDKLRIGNSFKPANAGDAKNSFASDKLQFSGFISPHISTGNSFLCDGPSVPLYSVSTDKHAVGAVSPGPDSSLHWNSIGVDSSCMPWMDSVDKSLESSSTKLVSGSFYDISNSSKWIPKSSQDSEARENTVQSSYISDRFQDVSVSDTSRGSSPITGEDSQYEATGLTSFARAPSLPDAGWKPHGVLVAHLQEHCSAVNDLATSDDNTFFVSASDDSTVKIWDTRKLEKDISFRSRLTYSVDGSRALCTTMFCGTSQVAVGVSDGTLHLFSVDYVSKGLGRIVEKYSGTADIKKNDVGEGSILSLLNYTSSDSFISQTLLYSTLRFGIHLWDTRSNSATWNFQVVPKDGYISSLVMGQCGNWFVSGSSRGVLTLWDLRFLLPVNSWKYSTVCPVERMCLYIPPANFNSAMARPLIYVAAGCNEVSLWNAESGSCHQVFRVASGENDTEMSNIPCALARSSSKTDATNQGVKQNTDSKYRIDELSEAPRRLSGIRSLLPLPGGDLLTGGTDLKIRYWDHNSPDRCYSVCGPSVKGISTYVIRSSSGVQVVQEFWRRVAAKLGHKALLAAAATDTAGCHRDSILSLASVKLNQRVLISGSRDGSIKVWK